jgi:hypothetical protein
MLSRKLLVRILLLALSAYSASSPAGAAVEISFFSREFGANNFPHAFTVMKGTVDATGEIVDESYGFTAKAVTPAILLGSVPGKVVNEPPAYVAKSTRQFSLTLDDDQYRAVMKVVEAWRNRAQPSYNLDERNCVHFTGELAQAAGLKVTFDPKLMKKPRSFLLSVKQANASLLEVAPTRVSG